MTVQHLALTHQLILTSSQPWAAEWSLVQMTRVLGASVRNLCL